MFLSNKNHYLYLKGHKSGKLNVIDFVQNCIHNLPMHVTSKH